MKVVKVTVGRSDKLSIPGAYESVGVSLSLDIEVQDGEDVAQVVAAGKAQLEPLYWWFMNQVYVEAVGRVTTGNTQWLKAKYDSIMAAPGTQTQGQ